MNALIDSAIDLQGILATSRYSQFLHQTTGTNITEVSERCCQEAEAFIKTQHLAVKDDQPIIMAYDMEIRNLEFDIMKHEAQQISAISLAAGYQDEAATYAIKQAILAMMKDRAALMKQDYDLRMELLRIEG